jgi:hypothetical protein
MFIASRFVIRWGGSTSGSGSPGTGIDYREIR